MSRIAGSLLMVVWLLAGIAQTAAPTATSDLSPRSLVEAAHRAAQSLDGYTFRLTSVTRHRGANGRYQAEKKNVLTYTFRKPNRIRLEWLKPRRKRGQLAVYNGTILRAAPSWLPFAVKVDPDSPTGRDDFHHPIYRSDLASLMNIVLQDMASVTEESYEGQVTVGKRQAHQVVLHTKENRVVLAIDTENFLPLAIEQYDRDSGLLVDGGYFEQLEPNPPLDDSLFRL